MKQLITGWHNQLKLLSMQIGICMRIKNSKDFTILLKFFNLKQLTFQDWENLKHQISDSEILIKLNQDVAKCYISIPKINNFILSSKDSLDYLLFDLQQRVKFCKEQLNLLNDNE